MLAALCAFSQEEQTATNQTYVLEAQNHSKIDHFSYFPYKVNF
jgi:hypothetical protein